MTALHDKVVVFTGAGAGIGRAVVARYVAEGAKVVAVDLSADGVDALTSELGDDVIGVAGDVSAWETNTRAVQVALDTWGRLDVFVGNAGISDGGRALEEIPGPDLPQAFQEIMGVNVMAPLLGVRAATDALIESRGAVILTASFASFAASGGGPLYTASKHAVLGLVRQLAYELAPDVRVNGVAPGIAPTRLRGITALGQEPADSVYEGTESVLPLQEVPTVEDYGGVFTLLASDESAIMTGTVITADSGLLIRGLARPGGRVAPRT